MAYTSVEGTLPAGTPHTVFTCPHERGALIQSIRVNNPGAYNFTVSKYTYNTSTLVQLYTVSLSAGDILTDINNISLRPGDYIQLTSDIANTNYIVLINEYNYGGS